jgi:hydroxymethylpyrimidine/phosphomethylpyrimidine kinase
MLVARLLPLATVVTPNLAEAEVLAGELGPKRRLAERIVANGAAAVIITGGHGHPVDHLFDGSEHVEIEVPRYDVPATHGAGCTHSAVLAAELAKGAPLHEAAETAAAVASAAVANGPTDIGAGEAPVDVLDLKEMREHDGVTALDRG